MIFVLSILLPCVFAQVLIYEGQDTNFLKSYNPTIQTEFSKLLTQVFVPGVSSKFKCNNSDVLI